MSFDSRNKDNDCFTLADALFWAASVVLLFWALGGRGLWTAEGRWAEIAREMLLNRNFFHPTINGQPYFDKPLMSYWLILPVSLLTGMNEWALRIPSAICGLLALWSTRYLGRRLWSVSVGRLAGWLLLTTYGFIFWGRTGEADMANLAFIMMAVTWYWHRRNRPDFVTYLVFYVLMFVGAQMKGLTAVIIPVLIIFPDLVIEKRWKNLLTWQHFAALGLGALVYLVPFLYSSMTRENYGSSGLSLVFRENVQRYFDPFDHVEPAWAYFEHVPVLFLPWSPVLIIAALGALASIRKWRSFSWHSRWLGLATLLIFAFFSASGSRRSYYILPILPFCALYVSLFLQSDRFAPWRQVALVIQSGLFLLITCAALVGVLAFGYAQTKSGMPLPVEIRYALMLVFVLSGIPWIMMWKGKEAFRGALRIPRSMLPLVLTAVFFFGGYFCAIQPSLERFRTEKQFGLAVKNTGRTADDVAFFQHHLENVVFYLDMTPPHHRLLPDSATVYEFLKSNTNAVVIMRRRSLDEMLKAFPADEQGRAAVSEQVFEWDKDKKVRKKIVAWCLDPSE